MHQRFAPCLDTLSCSGSHHQTAARWKRAASFAMIEDSFTIQKAHLHPDAGPLLEDYAAAFAKVWQHRDVLASFAARAEDVPPWQQAARLADAEATELEF